MVNLKQFSEDAAAGINGKKELLSKEWIKKWFRRDNLIILVLCGVLLMIIALPTKEENAAKETENAAKETENADIGNVSVEHVGIDYSKQNDMAAEHRVNGTETFSDSYGQELENKLEEILSAATGGQVHVMITFSSSEEMVVEKEVPQTRSNTTESDSYGGSRSIYQAETKETTVYTTQGNDKTPYVIKTLAPKVEGVLVAAQGAERVTVRTDIVEALQALFDLEAHKIKVVSWKGRSE